MIHPICLLRAFFRSLEMGAIVSGHDFRTDETETPTNVHVLKCKTCGHCSMSWSHESLESQK